VGGYDLSEYVDAKTRVLLFYKKFPEGVLRFEFKGVCEHNPEMIWGIAYAYKSPEDPLPATGTAAELAIGRTSFTKFSELQNLETSAWARAIGALGIGLENGIATMQEVALAKDRQTAQPTKSLEDHAAPRNNPPISKKQVDLITAMFNSNLAERDEYIVAWKIDNGLTESTKLNSYQASDLIDQLKTEGRVPVFKTRSREHDAIKDE
jgi:hypothetical protein